MDKIKRDELAIEECGRRYVRLCPETVLQDFKKHPSEARKLKEELNSVLELTAVENSEVHSSNISKPTQDIAVKRVDLAMQIAVLEQIDNMVDKALAKLSDTHREILELFFFKKGMMGYNVQEYADSHYMSIASVYRERRLALNAFAEHFEQYLNEE